MFPSKTEVSDFLFPAKSNARYVFSHLFFRLAILALAIFVANETGKIVTLISSGAPYSSVLHSGGKVLAAITLSLVLIVFTVWLKGAWPHVESRMLRVIRGRVFSEYLGKEVSVSEATGKTIGLFESAIASWAKISMIVSVEFPLNLSAFAVVFAYLAVTEIWLLPAIAFYVAVTG